MSLIATCFFFGEQTSCSWSGHSQFVFFLFRQFNVLRSLRVTQGSSVHSVRLWSVWFFTVGLRSFGRFSLCISVAQRVFNHSMGLRSLSGTLVTQCVFGYAVITQWVFGHAMAFRSLSKSSLSVGPRSRSSLTHGIFGHSDVFQLLSGSSFTQQGFGHLVGLRSLGGSSVIQGLLRGSSATQWVFVHTVGVFGHLVGLRSRSSVIQDGIRFHSDGLRSFKNKREWTWIPNFLHHPHCYPKISKHYFKTKEVIILYRGQCLVHVLFFFVENQVWNMHALRTIGIAPTKHATRLAWKSIDKCY